jgi:hypothetical protein
MLQLRMICVCVLATVTVAGCSTGTKPLAGTRTVGATPLGHGRIDDPRTTHVKCLEQAHIPVVEIGRTDLQIDSPPGGPTVSFLPTPGAAQQAQIGGTVQGAEVIGSALLYPNQASDEELKVIEGCLAEGVSG